MKHSLILFAVVLFCSCDSHSQLKKEDRIRINQLGFYPDGKKIAVVIGDSQQEFSVIEQSSGNVVHRGKLQLR